MSVELVLRVGIALGMLAMGSLCALTLWWLGKEALGVWRARKWRPRKPT